MGWIIAYFKSMWNQGAEQGKQMKKQDTEKIKSIVHRKKKQ